MLLGELGHGDCLLSCVLLSASYLLVFNESIAYGMLPWQKCWCQYFSNTLKVTIPLHYKSGTVPGKHNSVQSLIKHPSDYTLLYIYVINNLSVLSGTVPGKHNGVKIYKSIQMIFFSICQDN